MGRPLGPGSWKMRTGEDMWELPGSPADNRKVKNYILIVPRMVAVRWAMCQMLMAKG